MKRMGFSLKKFNQRQKEAITHAEGPLLVISGAGTGKTHVIAGRILNLILGKNVPAGEILGLTFNEKAAQEMQNRVEDSLPLGHSEIWIKTFHGFCETLLREKGFEIGIAPDYKLLTPVDVWLFLKQHVLDLKLEYYRSLGNPHKFLSILQDHFSRLQDEDITPQAYVSHAQNLQKNAKTPEEKETADKTLELARAYDIYENLLVTNGLMDFSGLIFWTLRLFGKRSSVLAEFQKRFRYILVDEFQDTNFAQNKLITLLSQKHRNLFVVGDDDQSIYKWRGAFLANIEYFNTLFPDAQKIVLVENYRSTQAILDSAYAVIQKNNPNRLEVTESLDKRLVSVRGKAKQQIPEIFHFETLDEEVKHVCMKASSLLKKGMNVAILVRTNALAKPFLEAFKNMSVPFQHFSQSDLLEKPAVKDCIALLHILVNPWDDVALFRCLSLPFWKIPNLKLLELNKEVRKTNGSLFTALDRGDFKQIKILIDDLIEFSREQSVSQVMRRFFKKSEYLDFVEGFTAGGNPLDDVARFSEKVAEFESAHEHKRVKDFVAYFELLQETGDRNSIEIALDPSAIKILTIHGAKGLEFDAVFVPGLAQNKFPSISRRDPLEIPRELIQEAILSGDHHVEEERRLFYVACTRARELLTLSYSDFYDGKRQWKESVFLAEMAQSGKANVRNLSSKSKKSLQQSALPLGERPHRGLVLNLPKLSYSQVETFRTCPLKYQFRYLFELPAVPSPQMNFGISLHNALRDFYVFLQKNPHEKDHDLSPLLKKVFEEHWISSGYSSRAIQEDQKKRGFKLLEQFYQKEKEQMVIPAFIEKQFLLKLDEGVTFTGRIDRIDQLEDGTYEVVDYKTGENHEKNLKNDLQLSLYALACRDALKIPVSRFSLYYLAGPEKLSTTRSNAELDAFQKEIVECARELATSDFSPTPGYHCSYCDYRLVCPVAAPIVV